MLEQSLQERYSPQSQCFGCGPANENGLHIRSFVRDHHQVVAHWKPQKMHEAFAGVLNGGIIGALLDCHCNWTAAWHLMQTAALDHPPCTVTAEYIIKLLKPTPSDTILELVAEVKESSKTRAKVSGKIFANGEACALCEGTFVAVKPGHPAYHRW